jgi:hypothetical protein
MLQVSTKSYAERVRARFAGARFAKEVDASRNQKLQTIEAARKSVATKLRRNKAYFADRSLKKPDLVFKQQRNKLYAVSIKYCNRYLEGVFDGETWSCDLQAAEVPEMLELFANDAEAGMFDAFIEPIMLANRSRPRKPSQ